MILSLGAPPYRGPTPSGRAGRAQRPVSLEPTRHRLTRRGREARNQPVLPGGFHQRGAICGRHPSRCANGESSTKALERLLSRPWGANGGASLDWENRRCQSAPPRWLPPGFDQDWPLTGTIRDGREPSRWRSSRRGCDARRAHAQGRAAKARSRRWSWATTVAEGTAVCLARTLPR